jgi:hypothetical protein
MIGAILAWIPVGTVVMITAVPALPIAIAGLLAAIPIMIVGLLLWLKMNLPEVDSKTAALVKHLNMYHVDDAEKDEKELKSQRMKDYCALVENYYILTTDMLHIIWGPHYSMYVFTVGAST